jgi:hypothetical protein
MGRRPPRVKVGRPSIQYMLLTVRVTPSASTVRKFHVLQLEDNHLCGCGCRYRCRVQSDLYHY